MSAVAERLRLGVIVGGFLAERTNAPFLPELARQAEAAGIDVIAVPDHVVLAADTTGYPYGNYPFQPTNAYLEPLTQLAAVAAVTSSLELAPSTLVVPLRPAALLAKQAATLDLLSGGRLRLGIGTGWHVPEFDATGVPFEGRGERLDDAMRACRALWRDSPASFSSATVAFDGVHCEPRPLSPESIRIWIGSKSVARTARRIAEYGHGWIPPPSLTPAEIGDTVARIREAVRDSGRDIGGLDVQHTLPRHEAGIEHAFAEGVPARAAAGVNVIQIPLNAYVSARDEVPAFLERAVAAFEPYRAG